MFVALRSLWEPQTLVADGTSTGAGTVTTVGAALWDTIESSSGAAIVTGNANALWDSSASSSGVATDLGVGAALWDAASSSSGTGAVTGAGNAVWNAPGASAGLAVVSGVGNACWVVAWTSTGLAIVTGTDSAIWDSTDTSDGLAIATDLGAALWDGVGTSAGTSLVTGDALDIWSTTWSSVGTSTAAVLTDDPFVLSSTGAVLALSLVFGHSATITNAVPGGFVTMQASAVINLVRDLIPDPVYDAAGTPSGTADGGLFRTQTLYRFLNDGVKALTTKIGWLLDDWTAVSVTTHMPTYAVNGQWHSFDEVFVNGWRLGRATEGYLLWPQKVESGQPVTYAIHNTTDHWTLRFFPAPNYTDATTTLIGYTDTAATTLTLTDATGFLPYGFLQIGSELFQYYNIASGVVTGLVRAVGGTTLAAHNDGAVVTHMSGWIKGVRMPAEITASTSLVEVPSAFQYPLQLYVLARCRQSENEYSEAARLMQEFNQECDQRRNDPRLKDSQGTQVRSYGAPVFGTLAWGRSIVS